MRGTRKGQDPIANQWVVLHRVGRDRAGPVDSTRTTADGRFHIRYRATGDSSALYFVSTKYRDHCVFLVAAADTDRARR